MMDPTPSATLPGAPAHGSPLRLTGRLDTPLSRWLWLVKWLLAIPHVVVLWFLWLGFTVVTVIAFFAIVFTGRYPERLFAFNAGVLRWTWRVEFYGFSTLGTDRYPPFSLDDDPTYPARLEIAYPARLSRGLPFVKWLLAFPHYLVLSAFSGSVVATASNAQEVAGTARPGLISLLACFAAIALLFAARYPRGIFDLLVGLHRWGYRVIAYVALMSDDYPPFRLDQGGDEPQTAAASAAIILP